MLVSNIQIGVPTVKCKGVVLLTTGGIKVSTRWRRDRIVRTLTMEVLVPVKKLKVGEIVDLEIIYPPDAYGVQEVMYIDGLLVQSVLKLPTNESPESEILSFIREYV